MSAPLLVVLAAILLGFAAVTTCGQSALSRLSRVALEEVARRRPAVGRQLAALGAHPRRHVAALLFVRTASEVGAAACAALAVVRWRGAGFSSAVIAAVVLTALGYVVLGLARAAGAARAGTVAAVAARPVTWLARIFGPLAAILPAAAAEGTFATEAELRDLVDQAEESGVVDRRERELINSVFELGDTIVREVMVPRTDMVFIERTKTIRQALRLALRSGYSRIPVVGAGEDDVVGIAYLKDLTRRHVEGGGDEPVGEVLREAVYVPDSKPVDELLREMQAARTHLAVVIDEYGGTAGLVTIEDILEEIVGEIADEYDRELPPVEALGDGRYRVTARLPVEDLAALVGAAPHDLTDDDDVETVAGLLAAALGRVPIPGASAEVAGLRLQAERTTGRRHQIGTVLVAPAGEEQHAPSAQATA